MRFGINFDHDITLLFCQIDDFCKEYESHLGQHLIGNTPVSGSGEGLLSLSEIMTILLLYHWVLTVVLDYLLPLLQWTR